MTRRELEVTDPQEIIRILDTCKVLHLGLVDEGQPYIVPMNYGYVMENEQLTIYLHSATQGYKLDVIQKNPVACFEMECDVTPFAGQVACQYGTSYSSLFGRGTVELVEDVEEKKKALTILMKTQTGKDFTFDDRMVSIVSVMKIQADSYTAKKRHIPAALGLYSEK